MADKEQLSYLQLVERNNDLVERLLGVLATVPVPEDCRPYPGWMQNFHLPTNNAAMGLVLRLESLKKGFEITLTLYDGTPIKRHVWEWD